MTSLRFPRRWFLALAALTALFGRSASARTIEAAATPSGRGLELAQLLPGRPDAAVIGRAYLADHPDEADLDRLLRHFDALAGAPGELRTAVSERLRRDFEERDTIRLHGWVLARTEARLCAICALLDTGAIASVSENPSA